jgi:hypothetical protein
MSRGPTDEESLPIVLATATLQLYGSLPIEIGSRSIRVLKVHHQMAPDKNGSLEGTMRIVSLPQTNWNHKGLDLEYGALSYVWGAQDPAQDAYSIRCNGCTVPLTKNCYDALFHLQHMAKEDEIWVDSICINQHDVAECSYQVTLMRDIYSHALAVWVWLASEPNFPGLHIGMRTLQDLSQGGQKEWKNLDTQDWQSIHDVLENNWFKRGWTFQELILASFPVFYSDQSAMAWHDLRSGIKDLQMHAAQTSSFSAACNLHPLTSLINMWGTISLRRRNNPNFEDGNVVWFRQLALTSVVSLAHLWLPCPDWFIQLYKIVINTLSTIFVYRNLRASYPLALAKNLPLYQTALLIVLYSWTCHSLVSAEWYFGMSSYPTLCYGVALFLWQTRLIVSHWSIITDAFVILSNRATDLVFLVSVLGMYDSRASDYCLTSRIVRTLWKDRQYLASAIAIAIRVRQVSNPKDKSYCMYGVLQSLDVHLTPPDYIQENEQVFKAFFLDLLRWQPAMLALLADAGMWPSSDISSLSPSWLPRWEAEPTSMWVPDAYIFDTNGTNPFQHFRRCGFPLFSQHDRMLVVWGRPIDVIESCFILPGIASPESDSQMLHKVVEWSLVILRRLDQESCRLQDSVAWDILAILIGESSFAPSQVSNANNWNTMQRNASQYFRVVFQRLFDKYYASLGARILASLDRAGKDAHDFQPAPEEVMQAAGEFHLTVQERICGKRLLFVTKAGRFGTGSLNIKSEDEVHFISGVGVPICLRHVSESCEYKVVGAAMLNNQSSDEIWKGRLRPTRLI